MLMRFFYSVLYTLVAPLFLIKLFKKNPGQPFVGKRWPEHFGFSPALRSERQPIWIHAVSVGEVMAVSPLIKELSLHTDSPILLTTTTPTGAAQAEKLGDLVEHRYMPLDCTFAVRRFIRRMQPSRLVIVETELWPNTLRAVAKAGIPISVINARLSERSFRRYQKVMPLFNLIAPHLTQVLCQYPDDARRFKELGISSERVGITGSVKFDFSVTEQVLTAGHQLRDQLGRQRPVWIAASTHKGEDEIVLAAHQKLLQHKPDALLILVPRHPQRFDDVYALTQQLGFSVQRRTQQTLLSESKPSQVYLGDTLGELLLLIQATDICFMGGSLLGDKVGGHNFIEPAALAKPILTGPSYFNFNEIANRLFGVSGLMVVNNDTELAEKLISLIANPELSEQTGQAAYSVFTDNKGAIEKTIAALDLTTI
ncbi:lipid IV(A) 3-deoxy-D-manno-octulosonic acid transferase [Vibrio sp.]|uniref:lipid IV(A) 3-deoxy-D-manno-octulosonic acid transferase n=1 Tax=Vibrio sp. TaxID=678 RepID=UPI003D0B5975